MPIFYLRHNVFGAKVAISDAEMAADLENGWEEFDPVAERLAASQPVEPLQPKRRGRRKSSDVPNFLVSVDDDGD